MKKGESSMAEPQVIETRETGGDRVVAIPTPNILLTKSLEELIGFIGEELTHHCAMKTVLNAFRANVRNNALKRDPETNKPKYTDEEIAAMDFSEWRPTGNIRKNKVEKAFDYLDGLSDEKRAAVLQEMKEKYSI
jgi:hypothetical protein